MTVRSASIPALSSLLGLLVGSLVLVSTATAQVPADDDPRRPQVPPGAGKTKGIGSILGAPFRPLGAGFKSGAIWYEENCGSVSGGVNAVGTAACFPPWLSVHFGSIGTRSGFLGGGFGLHYNQFGRTGLKFGSSIAATTRGYSLGTAYVGWNDPLSAPFYVRATGNYDFDARNEFFGLGPDSDDDGVTDFAWERFGVDLVAGVPRQFGIWGDVGVKYEKSFLFEGRNDVDPNTIDEFPDLAGFEGQQEFVAPHASVVIDITDAPGQPTRGFKLKGDFAAYRSQNDLDFDWNQYGASGQVHIPVVGAWHMLSAIVGFEEVEPDGDSAIPFAYLPTLGGSKRLRGFDSWRFRDNAVAYGSLAYRYRVWVNQGRVPDDNFNGSFETVLFVDYGTVADDLSDIDIDDLETAYGFEFRVYFAESHAFGVGLAGSDEGVRFNIAMEDVW